jgi:hypothetical protein
LDRGGEGGRRLKENQAEGVWACELGVVIAFFVIHSMIKLKFLGCGGRWWGKLTIGVQYAADKGQR